MSGPPLKECAPPTGTAGNASKTVANKSITPTPPEGLDPVKWALLATANGGDWHVRERNAGGEVVGTSVRKPDGAKTTKPGEKRGLIVAWPLADYAGSSAREPVIVCEGATDTAAALTLGFDAVGVPMAGHCGAWLAEVLADRHAVIVADADDAGRRGADKIARALLGSAASVRVIEPPREAKDLRAALLAGATKAEVAALADAAEAEERDTPEPEGGGAFEPFPVGVLPEPVRGFVVEAAKAIGCDETYIALPMLSALAAAIGNTHRVELKRGWLEPAIVWAAIVGESGTMKTPAFKAAMKATRNAQGKAFGEHAEAMKEHETAHLIYEAELAAWKRKAGKGEGGDPPEKPTPPTARRYVVSDTTVEALAPILLGNPRGVLLARDELAGWVGSFDRYAGGKGADSANWLSFHNGEMVTVDRKTGTPPTIHVPSASVSIAGGIQPGILARALSQEHHESGLLARVLFAMPPRKAKRWTKAEVSERTEAAVAAVFDWLFALSADTDDDGGERPRVLRLSADGKAAWVRFYTEHAQEQSELTGDLAAAWSKLEGYAARLALVVHMVRWVAKDPTLGDPDRVDEVSVQAGVAMARWFGGEARRVYAVLGEDDDDRETRQLLELVRRKGGSVSGRELVQSSRMFKTVGDAEEALSALAAAGAGEWAFPPQTGRGGTKAKRFTLPA